MIKGRPRIAPEIHKINGSYEINPNRENKKAPSADGREPVMPDYFGEDECQKWLELCGDLKRMGVLSTDTREIMIAYCCAYGGWMECRRQLKKFGMVLPIKDENGKAIDIKRNPYSVELHKYRDEMNRLLPEFGLTPSSRSRLVSFSNTEEDPFEQWLAARGTG